MITDDQLALWEKLADAATPVDIWRTRVYEDQTGEREEMLAFDPFTDHNLAFIAASREAVPALIAEARALRQQLERARELLQRLCFPEDPDSMRELGISTGAAVAFLAEQVPK